MPFVKKRFGSSSAVTIVGGLCGGIVGYLNADPLIVRSVFPVMCVDYGGVVIACVLSCLPAPENLE